MPNGDFYICGEIIDRQDSVEKRRISKHGRISWVSGSQGIILEIIIFSVALNKSKLSV